MAKVSTNISLDEGLKKASQQLFADLGIDITTAVTIFLKQCIRVQGLPFEIIRDNSISDGLLGGQINKHTDANNGNESGKLKDTNKTKSDTVSDMVDMLLSKFEESNRPVTDASVGVQDSLDFNTQFSFGYSQNESASGIDDSEWHKEN